MMRLTAAGLLGTLLVAGPAAGQPVRGGPDLMVMRLEADDLNRYEAMYGAPQFRSLDEELHGPEDWPRRRSIRTEGRVWEVPFDDAEGNRRHGFGIRGERHSLRPQPVEELLGVWASHLPFWVKRRVEVVGAFDPDVAPTRFLVWEISVLPEREEKNAALPTDLEDLVVDPTAHVGRRVTVTGTFRGANLFEDMSEESQRAGTDWVLNDGPFFIWVTGHPPRGSGFSLDPTSPADCRWRLAVVGVVETHEGFVYVAAEEVLLLGPAPEAN